MTRPNLKTTQNYRMDFTTLLETRTTALSYGSVYELMRRSTEVEFDPQIGHAGLIYHPHHAEVLAGLMRSYIDTAIEVGLPIVTGTATWRANPERIGASIFAGRAVNEDNVCFLTVIRDEYQRSGIDIYIKADVGPRGDAYKPEQALTVEQAQSFHAEQIERLSGSEIDYLQASTLPALSEATGIALLMARTGLPYVISFVVDRDGCLLDGNRLSEAVRRIDDAVESEKTRFAVNCVHPSVLRQAIDGNLEIAHRIVSFSGNTSARPTEELDGLAELDTQTPLDFAHANERLLDAHAIPIIGACCGSSPDHIQAIAKMLIRR